MHVIISNKKLKWMVGRKYTFLAPNSNYCPAVLPNVRGLHVYVYTTPKVEESIHKGQGHRPGQFIQSSVHCKTKSVDFTVKYLASSCQSFPVIFTGVCRVPKCPTALNVRQILLFSKSVILGTKININSKISKYFKKIISEKYSESNLEKKLPDI